MEKEEHTALWILILGCALFLTLIYDLDILHAISNARTTLVSMYFVQLSFIFTVPVMILAITLFLLKHKKLIIPWLVTSITTMMFSVAFKYAIGQPRPYEIYPDIIPLVPETLFSFPSARTAVIFSALPLLAKYHKRFFLFWLFFALLTGFSRLYLGVHFPSDIVAGMLVGYLFGKMTLYTAEQMGKL